MEDLKKTRRKAVLIYRAAWAVGVWWSLAEAAHYAVFRIRFHQAQHFTKPPPFPRERRLRMLHRATVAVRIASEDMEDALAAAKEYYTGWFAGCDFEEIYRDNIKDMLACNTLMKHLSAVTDPVDLQDLEDHVANIEQRIGQKFPEGYNRNIRFITQAFEVVHAWHRPLIIYVGISILNFFGGILFQLNGFTRLFHGSLRYWHRKPKDTVPDSAPIVFFHGISPGLFPYFSLIKEIGVGREMILVELPSVSMNWYSQPYNGEQFVNEISHLLHVHGIQTACFMGHSFGSVPCGWIVHYCPSMIDSLVLLDPVTVLLCLSKVAASFLHRHKIRKGRAETSRSLFMNHLVNFIVEFFASRELGIATTLNRHLWWFECMLLGQDMPENTSVILSELDHIVPVSSIQRYLTRYNNGECKKYLEEEHRGNYVRLDVHEGMPHAGFLFSSKFRSRVVSLVRSYH